LSKTDSPGILARPEVGSLFRKRHRLFTCLLSLVLLLAQLGMQAHAYSHLKSDPHGVPTSLQYCGGCLSFTPMSSLGGSAAHVHVWHQADGGYHAPLGVAPVASRQPTAAFRSRAPPAFL
jgi:hypothetical protein